MHRNLAQVSRPIPVTEVVVSYASHITIHVSFSRCVFWLALVVSVVTVRTNASAESHRRAAGPKSAPAASSLPAIRVGNLLLTLCKGVPAYCGSVIRPFDPAGEVSGTIAIGFELILHQDESQPALETIVATEGGPGYPSTGTASSYVGLFAPLMDRHDLLLVDNRGTGRSHVIDCETLLNSAYLFVRGIALCGAFLGPASDLYGSGLAADDLAAVLEALGIGQIDLYGDSYAHSSARHSQEGIPSALGHSSWTAHIPWLDSRPSTRKQLRLRGTLSSRSAGSRSPVAIFLETRLAVSCHCSMSFA